MFRKIVKLGWSEQTSSLGSVAFLLASFVPDTLEREQHQTASGLLKSSIELGKSTAALKALGESPETRGQSAQCGKCEQNLQAALARCNKFHNKATESQDDLCYEFLKESGRLIDEGNMILKRSVSSQSIGRRSARWQELEGGNQGLLCQLHLSFVDSINRDHICKHMFVWQKANKLTLAEPWP